MYWSSELKTHTATAKINSHFISVQIPTNNYSSDDLMWKVGRYKTARYTNDQQEHEVQTPEANTDGSPTRQTVEFYYMPAYIY